MLMCVNYHSCEKLFLCCSKFKRRIILVVSDLAKKIYISPQQVVENTSDRYVSNDIINSCSFQNKTIYRVFSHCSIISESCHVPDGIFIQLHLCFYLFLNLQKNYMRI